MNNDQPYSPWNAPDPQPWDVHEPSGNVLNMHAEDPNGCAPCDVSTEVPRYGAMGVAPMVAPKDYAEMTADELASSDYGRDPRFMDGRLIGAVLTALAFVVLSLILVSVGHAIDHAAPVRLAAPITHGFEGGK